MGGGAQDFYGKVRTMKGVCTGQKTVELTGHLGSCCGASFTITTESVMVLISEIVPAVCVPELPVTVS
jgi:hypothetical protein